MAGVVMPNFHKCLAAMLAVWGASQAVPALAADAGLPDPMRPAVASLSSSGEANAADEPVGQVLQSVILRKGRRPAAIISGQLVELGGEMAGARVTAITDSEVVLQGPTGKEVLKLTPAVSKQPVVQKRVAGAAGKNKKADGREAP